jgi:hypothetical protein
MSEAGRVVTELAEYPGAEDGTEPGQAVEDLGVRVLVKRCSQRVFEVSDRFVGGGEGAHGGADRLAHGGLDGR